MCPENATAARPAQREPLRLDYPRGVTTFALRTLSLRPGQEERRVVHVDVDPLLLGGAEFSVASPIAVELTIQRAVTGDLFRLVFSTVVTGPCMRCLQPATQDVKVEASDYEAERGDAPAELHTEYVREGELDLSAWARDQIAFVLPEQILCRPDCAGLCPVCGKDLNEEPHEHDDVVVDPRWAALEALRREE
jgi:uncharacterized protein